MRYLNKIVFINSAAIPYAEIQLDGNIHFIGTQGVGKSTILRAILYFYNADSRRLGMPKGPTAKSFADWYLKYSNSYLVYEVQKETGAFCVLAFKSQNRVCYRFIDSAYDSKYFMDENGEVFSHWELIREKLNEDKVDVTNMITGFEQYRDILYGNHNGNIEFTKYALLEAKQYNNIYRTIQNVFLNTKLDANEIKQTIISSMEDEMISIDLEKYAHHLSDFEIHISDIRRFRTPKVLTQAENAIQMLSAIRHLNREQSNLTGELLWRLNNIEKQKPAFVSKKNKQETILERLRGKQQKEGERFEKQRLKINDRVSQLKGKLQDSAKQKEYYQSIDIEKLIKRVAAKEDKRLELKSLKQEHTVLTNNYSDISSRFETLIKDQKSQLSAFLNQKEKQLVDLEKEELQAITGLNQEYEKLIVSIENEHENELKNKESDVAQKREAVHALEKEKLNLKHKRFFEDEIAQAQQLSSESNIQLRQEANNIESYKQQVDNLQTKWEIEKADAQKTNKSEQEKLQTELENHAKEKESLLEKINRSEDSLYGWLNQNKSGWGANIGKVIDEELLFKAGLSPKIDGDPESFFGVKINLDEIGGRIKTIDDYRLELTELDGQIESKQKELEGLAGKLEKELEKIQQRNHPKIKELKEKLRQAEYNCEQLQRAIEKAKVEKESFTLKASEEKKVALEAIQSKLDEAIALKQDAVSVLDKVKNQLKSQKEEKQQEKAQRINQAKEENAKAKGEIQTQIDGKRQQVTTQIETFKSQRSQELNDKGADTKRLTEIDLQITNAKNELRFIEKYRDTVSEYKKDKRELFDRETEFENSIQIQEGKLKQLKEEFDVLVADVSNQLNETEKAIETISEDIKVFENDEAEHEKFLKSSLYQSIEVFKNTSKPTETNKTAALLIEELKEKHYQKTEKQNVLKTNVDKLLSHFSEGNIFKFPTKLIETEEYLDWADELTDFIEEGKIDQYEKLTNERFSYIIGSIGKETTMLVSKTGEIKKIIDKINADFKQKNFVTAVNNIELDIMDSKNTAVLLLKKIKEFNDAHSLDIGMTNLFAGTGRNRSNERAIELLKQLIKEIRTAKDSIIRLTDSFELSFRIEENGNDTGWVEKLSNIGSEGTDVLVKAMINIMLLNVFKDGASRKFKDFKLHCMMDEIGKLHPNNVKGILKFANDRNILLINGSPTESTPLNYRHIYKLSKDANKKSRIKRIISNPLAG